MSFEIRVDVKNINVYQFEFIQVLKLCKTISFNLFALIVTPDHSSKNQSKILFHTWKYLLTLKLRWDSKGNWLKTTKINPVSKVYMLVQLD